MRSTLRDLASRVLPGYMAERARRYESGLRERMGVTESARRHVQLRGEVVIAGPFEGMRYPAGLLPEVDAPLAKLLGVYERELEAVIRGEITRLPGVPEPCFLDLGCADGYYAVGMALAVPGLRVIAFDLAVSARTATARLAEADGVALELRKGAKPSELRNLADSADLLLCDIEGAEVDVLTVDVVERLRRTRAIVEIHEGRRPGAEKVLRERFAASHDIRIVEFDRGSRRADPPGVSEMRVSAHRWGIFTPKRA